MIIDNGFTFSGAGLIGQVKRQSANYEIINDPYDIYYRATEATSSSDSVQYSCSQALLLLLHASHVCIPQAGALVWPGVVIRSPTLKCVVDGLRWEYFVLQNRQICK